MKISRLNRILIILFIVVLTYIIRIYFHIEFSPLRGTYDPGVQYGAFSVIQNGFIQEFTVSSSYTTNLINGGIWLGEYARYTLNPILLIIIGKTSLIEMATTYKFFLWQGVILLPLIALMILQQLSKLYRFPLSLSHYIIIYLFTSLGSTSIISTTSVGGVMDYYGWSLLLIIFYLNLKSLNSKNYITSFLTILFVITLQLYHHTSALFYFFIITSIFLYQKLALKKRELVTNNQYTLSIMIFISYLIYLTYSFNGYLAAFKSSILSMLNPTSLQYQQTQGIFTDILEPLSLSRIIIRGLNVFFICMPVLLILYYTYKQKLNDKNTNLLIAWILALIPISMLLFGWGGFGGFFFRLTYLLSILSIVSVIYLLIFYTKSTEKFLLYSIIFLCIFSSIYSYSSSDFGAGNSLTWSEYSCINKIGSSFHKDAVIYSDSRLASPLIYFNFIKVKGLEDEGAEIDALKRTLDDYLILFSSEDVNKLNDNIDNLTIVKGEFIILSNQFTRYPPGIHSYLKIFKPASPMYQNKFKESKYFNHVYDNQDVNIFLRT